MAKTTEKAPRGGCLSVLIALKNQRWRAPAYALNRLGLLNERGRISDLRHRWGVTIRADTRRRNGATHTTYIVPVQARQRAQRLITAGLRQQRQRERQKKE